MADNTVPYFHNTAGVPMIEIGSKKFKCTGARAPYDHPHVYLDMGDDNEIVCPYCSTLYRYVSDLGAREARPAEAAYAEGEVA